MKIFTSLYRSILLFTLIFISANANAQTDTGKIKILPPTDTGTIKPKLNMDAVYNRPFLALGKIPIAIGGYLEANTFYEQTNGISDGFGFQARRLTIFMSSTITNNIKFLSEIEFEDGTKEINIEFAAMDIEFHPLLNLRGGIVMNPIGSFNQNHDGPRWDFIDRPISSTTIIPSTFSNVGFGLHGKIYNGSWAFGYESYLTNGMDNSIISNAENRTSLPASKRNLDRFEENFSGAPMFTEKVALRHRKIGEIGLSYLNGVYNQWMQEGLQVDNKRRVQLIAVDFNTSQFKNKLYINGEFVKALIDVPETYSQTYGTAQFGGFTDIIYTVLQKKILSWERARLNVGMRLEYTDYNQGTFRETGGNIADHLWSVMPSIALRPAGSTVIRLNYRYKQQTDLLGNPPARSGAILFGFSTYF